MGQCESKKKCTTCDSCPLKKYKETEYGVGWIEKKIRKKNAGAIPVQNVEQCRQIAEWNKEKNIVAFNYREKTHPNKNFRNTCELLTEVNGTTNKEDNHRYWSKDEKS